MTVRVVIMARFPVPGRCKTRLIPALGAAGAAGLHRRLAEATVTTAGASGLAVEVWGTGATPAEFAEWLPEVDIHPQPEGDLGEKLLAAADPCPVLFLGTDCPDLTDAHLKAAGRALEEGRFVIGPAHDGGYWTIGLPRPVESLFHDIPWGTEDVFNETMDRMTVAGITPQILETLHDLDRPEDLRRYPDLLP